MKEIVEQELTPLIEEIQVIGKWKPYVSYKDSGIAWLEQIPTHWTIGKMGVECTVKARLGWKGLKASEYVYEGYMFLSTPDIKERDINFKNVNFITAERYFESPEIMLKHGDVLIAKDGSTLGITNVVRYLPAPTTVNSSIAVIRPHGALNSIFLHWFLSSNYVQEYIQSIKNGMGVPHLFQSDIRKFVVFIPPEKEQQMIASFLDRETAKINALIAKRNRMIELLQERRTAVINQAMIKGLNSNVEMKNSGFEWLGEIPKHWELRRIKHLAKMVSKGTTPTTIGATFLEKGSIRFLKAENIVNGKVADLPLVFINDYTNKMLKRSILEDQDILMVIAGATIGKVSILLNNHVPANTNQAVAFIRLYNKNYVEFTFYWLTSLRLQEQIQLNSVQSAQPNLSLEDIRNFVLPFPPLNEMQQIVSCLDQETTKINKLITGIQQSIEKLKEYNAALISAAVTGKIDVRDEFASEPVESIEGAV